MFKRMSVLLRREQDDRAAFALKWERHGEFVKKLPHIRRYMQNHVVEDFAPGGPFEADGVVELLFETPEDMNRAFTSPEAAPVKADEPGFLGHGTGYALSNISALAPAEEGNKLIVMTGADVSLVTDIGNLAEREFGAARIIRDDVQSLIARPEMRRDPQPVAYFLHLHFRDANAASAAGKIVAARFARAGHPEGSVFRVRTHTVI